MTSLCLSIPYPPTANNLFKNVRKGRVKTTGYTAWITEAVLALRAQRAFLIRGRYCLTITAIPPDRRARDIDNLIKPISDTLKKAGIIEEDSKAKSVLAAWSESPPVKGGEVRLLVEAYPPALQVAA